MRTDDEIRKLAIARLAGQFYSDQDIPKNLMTLVFMPLGLMDKAGLDDLKAKAASGEAVMIYAVINEKNT